MQTLFFHINRILNRPLQVAFFCSLFALGTLLLQGTLIDLWTVKSEKKNMAQRIARLSTENMQLATKVQQAQKSHVFLEKEAKEKLEMLKQDELVFIFGENDL